MTPVIHGQSISFINLILEIDFSNQILQVYIQREVLADKKVGTYPDMKSPDIIIKNELPNFQDSRGRKELVVMFGTVIPGPIKGLRIKTGGDISHPEGQIGLESTVGGNPALNGQQVRGLFQVAVTESHISVSGAAHQGYQEGLSHQGEVPVKIITKEKIGGCVILLFVYAINVPYPCLLDI